MKCEPAECSRARAWWMPIKPCRSMANKRRRPSVRAAQVIRRVEALPEAQRETVFLAYVEGLSYREVADVLQVPIGTVMSRLAAARLKLAEYPPLHTVPNPSTGERR